MIYNGIEDYAAETRRLYSLAKLCFDCESKDCCFNHKGDCRFAMVHGCRPIITDEDGCTCYCYADYTFERGEQA